VMMAMMAVSGVARSMILWLMGVGSSAANIGAMKSMSGCRSICFMMVARVLYSESDSSEAACILLDGRLHLSWPSHHFKFWERVIYLGALHTIFNLARHQRSETRYSR
jgi:hypothetical protein